ncbi:MAG: sodium:proton antiporter [Planctomycetia bacterium]|nr:sodium:proton antiporter [Planctomycetia bacterium]
MDHAHADSGSDKPLLTAIAVILVVYAITAVFGWPEAGARKIGEANHAKHIEHAEPADHAAEATAKEIDAEEYGLDIQKAPPPYWMVIPFVALLGAIAVLPLVPATEHWWDSNLNRFKVAAALGALTLLYYLFFHDSPIDGHFPVHYVVGPSPGALNWAQTWTVLANAMLNEYVPFIMLLFSLYTISGGIRITGDLRAHPKTNVMFIAIGGVLASLVGTTGAAMLLIRPLLETNRERKYVVHTVIFFIFVVCNCGGCLLPLGDPPLFLGYLRGVDFLWTLNLWKEWLFVNGLLLAIYYLFDHFRYYPRELPPDVSLDETRVSGLKITGLWPNAVLLLGVILSVALLDPNKIVPFTEFRPWVYLREIVQLGLVGLSLIGGEKAVRQENNFNYHALVEVAALFSGIFICMQPALQILGVRGPDLGLASPTHFFWATGSLSSVLDNAPTYVVFFETAQTIEASPGATLVAGVQEHLLVAVSLGAVFMGAMTYIGNGPNFMVRAIAEKSGVKMPSFFGYMLWSCLILLPIFALTTLLFL